MPTRSRAFFLPHRWTRSHMDMPSFRSLIETIEDVVYREQVLDEVVSYDPASGQAHRIDEGKWIPTGTSDTMRIDHATHGAGQTHVHIYGRKGDQLGVVNLDGTGSHGTRMRLSKDQAAVLRRHNFKIRHDRIVEWIFRPSWTRALLLG